MTSSIIWFEHISKDDVAKVGGKNASLGEMITHLKNVGVNVPRGFATTAAAYFDFIKTNQLAEPIQQILSALDVENINQLQANAAQIRKLILNATFSVHFEQELRSAYEQLKKETTDSLRVAVRSSATAEDLPEASFAGQQETFLNIQNFEQVLIAIKHVFASLYNDRAIAYRVHQGFSNQLIALSAGIQQMVRSDEAVSGVMFTLDTESGFDQVVFLTASYGLGETIVQGQVNPDEFYIFKPNIRANRPAILKRTIGSKEIKMIFKDGGNDLTTVQQVPVEKADQSRFSLTDEEINQLASHAILIEQHYGCPMDIEWAKDGENQQLYIVQARPETVKSRSSVQTVERYRLNTSGTALASGRSVGQKIGKGRAQVLLNCNDGLARFAPGDVLVTDMTDPDWEPIMKRAAAIVTNRGGRTCHAAIIARELGIPAVVGCGNATTLIKDNQEVTVSCAEGDTGYIYLGLLDFEIDRAEYSTMPSLPFKVMLNVGNPDMAFESQSLPNAGVGLARIEFIINQMIGIHPNALLAYERLDNSLKTQITARISAYPSPTEFYIERLKEGISVIAAAFYPKPVIVRLSDFKSNEYANLLGGDQFEPKEENPMLGFRGASRYIDDQFKPCFELECAAIKRVRNGMGLNNVEIMIPFVRTIAEAKNIIETLKTNDLVSGENGLRIIMMCEIPSNALLADEFLNYFDGFSIGSNDLTQLTLGLDRDSAIIAHQFDERNEAIKKLLRMAIQACKSRGKYIGICGQGPSDHLDFAAWLAAEGIDSISLSPDSVVDTWLQLGLVNNAVV